MNKTSVFVIAIGIFAIVNTEMGMIPLLSEVARVYRIELSQAGLLVSLFALIVAVFGPFTTLLATRFDGKKTLLLILGVFAASNALSALAPNFAVLMLARVVPAFFLPIYFSIALAAAASAYPPEQRAKASAIVFTGSSLALVAGLSATSFIATQFSLQAAFWFSLVLNAAAWIWIKIGVPSMPAPARISYAGQMKVLLKARLWWAIPTVIFISAGTYSVYSYMAEYLTQVMGIGGSGISLILILFGISGVIGVLLTGRLLSASPAATTALYPVVFVSLYILLYYAEGFGLATIAIVLVWGALHTSGLVIVQNWLASEATEAPVFAGSLYMSLANGGVTLGASASAWVFSGPGGIHQIVWVGMAFLLLALVFILVKVKRYGAENRHEISA